MTHKLMLLDKTKIIRPGNSSEVDFIFDLELFISLLLIVILSLVINYIHFKQKTQKDYSITKLSHLF